MKLGGLNMAYDPRSWPRGRIRNLTLDESADLQELLDQLKSRRILEGRRYALDGTVLLRLIMWLERYAEIYEIGVQPSLTRRPQDERRSQDRSAGTEEDVT